MSSFKNKLVKLFFPLTKVDVAYLVLVLSVANVLVGNIKFRYISRTILVQSYR